MSYWKYFATAFMIFYVLVFTSAEIMAVTKPIYELEYDKYKVYDLEFVKQHKVDQVTDDILLYLSDLSPDMNRRNLFEPREHRHMVDVKTLFTFGKILRILFLPLIGLLISQGLQEKAFMKKLRISYSCFILGFVVISVFGSLQFEKAFIKFHQLFFNNDYWLLYPEDSIIINLMPEGFFMDMGKYIIIAFLGLNALSYFLLSRLSKEKINRGTLS